MLIDTPNVDILMTRY